MFLIVSCSCLCSIYWSQVLRENEDVVDAAPTGNAPTTPEWSTIFVVYWGVAYIRGLTIVIINFILTHAPGICELLICWYDWFKDYKRYTCIHIFNHNLFGLHILPVLHSQYHACRWSGAFKRHWAWGGGGGGFSVGFRIWMLSTTQWLEMLKRAKKVGWNYSFCQFWAKNRGRNTTFSSFLLKYRGRNYTNFPGTRKWRVEMAEHM